MNITKIVLILLLLLLIVFIIRFAFMGSAPYVPTPTVPTSEQASSTATSTVRELHISIRNYAFEPQDYTVDSGTNVVWTNNDSVQHTVDGGQEFKSAILQPGDTYSHVFTDSGSFPYSCTIHPSMKGQINVR